MALTTCACRPCFLEQHYEYRPTGKSTTTAKCHSRWMEEIEVYQVSMCGNCDAMKQELKQTIWMCEVCEFCFDGEVPPPCPVKTIAEHAFVINLSHRIDRWKNVQKELKGIGYDSYERFNAYGINRLPPSHYYEKIDSFKMNGWYGNKFSHYGVIEEAKSRDYDCVLVLEDDVTFHQRFNDITHMAIRQLKGREWDWLQFGGNHIYFNWRPEKKGHYLAASPIDGMPYRYVPPGGGLVPVALNLGKVHRMLTAHAYVAKRSVYDFILEHAITSPLSIDGFYAYEVHPRFKCYSVMPCMASQIPGRNDIDGTDADYTRFIGD